MLSASAGMRRQNAAMSGDRIRRLKERKWNEYLL